MEKGEGQGNGMYDLQNLEEGGWCFFLDFYIVAKYIVYN